MSRRCPKKNHLILNWLKANHSRFPFEPRIENISKLHISGHFVGISKAISFHIYRGNHIDVVVNLDGHLWGYLGEFLFLEKYCNKGYTAYWPDLDSNTYYSSRAELWIKECFEPFLEWCNAVLATSRWLALYSDKNDGYTKAMLQNSESPIINMVLQNLLFISTIRG